MEHDDEPTRDDAPAGGGSSASASGHSVWIEAEDWGEPWDPRDEASDVVVTMPGGDRWIASFVAYGHLPTLVARNRESGECLGGIYLWATDLILVEEISRPTIEAVVADLIRDGGFESAFTRYEE